VYVFKPKKAGFGMKLDEFLGIGDIRKMLPILAEEQFNCNIAMYPMSMPRSYPCPVYDELSALMMNKIWRMKTETIEYDLDSSILALFNVMQFFFFKASKKDEHFDFYLA
jgi:hypothetical protein